MNIEQVAHNHYVQIALAFLIALYAAPLSIELPPYIRNLFSNDIFRVVFLSLLMIYHFDKAPHIALIIALVFVITLHYIGNKEAHENYAHIAALKKYMNERR